MAKLLSKRIGSTIIRGDIVPQYAQTISTALNKALIDLGIESSPSKFDGTFKVGNDTLEIDKETVDNKDSFEEFLQNLEKNKSLKAEEYVAATITEKIDSKDK